MLAEAHLNNLTLDDRILAGFDLTANGYHIALDHRARSQGDVAHHRHHGITHMARNLGIAGNRHHGITHPAFRRGGAADGHYGITHLVIGLGIASDGHHGVVHLAVGPGGAKDGHHRFGAVAGQQGGVAAHHDNRSVVLTGRFGGIGQRIIRGIGHR